MRSLEKMDSDMIRYFTFRNMDVQRAELTPEKKNELSHRGKALRTMKILDMKKS